MKYKIGDFILFIDPITKDVKNTGTVFKIRKIAQPSAEYIYSIFHQERGLIYEYPEWHLEMHTMTSQNFKERYGK